MSKPRSIPPKLQTWIEARKRFRLSHAQVQMARELGLNPKKLRKVAHIDQPWKLPLPQYIEQLYRKRFGRDLPEDLRSIEEKVADQRKRKAERNAAKVRRCQSLNDAESADR